MNCRAVKTRLVAWQDEELAPGEHVLVREHLAACADCRTLEQRLARATPRPFLSVPADTRQKMWSRLDAAIDAAWNEPPPPPPTARRRVTDWLRHEKRVATGWLVGYGVVLAAVAVWGLGNWWVARELRASSGAPLAATAPAPDTSPVRVPTEQYRPASWSPPAP